MSYRNLLLSITVCVVSHIFTNSTPLFLGILVYYFLFISDKTNNKMIDIDESEKRNRSDIITLNRNLSTIYSAVSKINLTIRKLNAEKKTINRTKDKGKNDI